MSYMSTYDRLKAFEHLFSLPSEGESLRENYLNLRSYLLNDDRQRRRIDKVTKQLMQSIYSEGSIASKVDEYLIWAIVNALASPRGTGSHIRQHWVSYSYIRGFANSENKGNRTLRFDQTEISNGRKLSYNLVTDNIFIHGKQSVGSPSYYEDVLEKLFANIETYFGCFKGDRQDPGKHNKTGDRVHGIFLMMVSLAARSPEMAHIRSLEDFCNYYDEIRRSSEELYLVTYKTKDPIQFNAKQIIRSYHSVRHDATYYYAPIGSNELVVFGSSKPSLRTTRKIAAKADRWISANAERNSDYIYGKKR